MVDAPFGTDENPLPEFEAPKVEPFVLQLGRVIHATPPPDLEGLEVSELIGITRSMIQLNRSLVDGYNQTARTFEILGKAMSDALEEWANFADRLEAAEQAAAEQGSETSAAADDSEVARWEAHESTSDDEDVRRWDATERNL